MGRSVHSEECIYRRGAFLCDRCKTILGSFATVNSSQCLIDTVVWGGRVTRLIAKLACGPCVSWPAYRPAGLGVSLAPFPVIFGAGRPTGLSLDSCRLRTDVVCAI